MDIIKDARQKITKRRERIKELEKRKKAFDSMPIKRRKVFESVGCSPYQDGEPIRRTNGKFI